MGSLSGKPLPIPPHARYKFDFWPRQTWNLVLSGSLKSTNVVLFRIVF